MLACACGCVATLPNALSVSSVCVPIHFCTVDYDGANKNNNNNNKKKSNNREENYNNNNFAKP